LVAGAVAEFEEPVAEVDGGVIHDQSLLIGEQSFVATVGRDEAFRHKRLRG
jgi:hypothetical protein